MSNTTLKVIATIAMLIDHIFYFFPGIPHVFHWIGRVSAPIFLFCCVLGYIYTSNRKRFFLRIYSLSVVVEVMNHFLGIDYLRMNFIRTILLTICLIFIFDKFRNKNKKAYLYLFGFILCHLVSFGVISSLANGAIISDSIAYLLITILVNFANLDGGILLALVGLFFYIFKNSKVKLSISFIILTLSYLILFNSALIPRIVSFLGQSPQYSNLQTAFISFCKVVLGVDPIFDVTTDILFGNPQWMMIFSLIFILMYNDKKGRGLKWFFYIFYPLHIAVLYIISSLLISK